jgi:hypothetical protein
MQLKGLTQEAQSTCYEISKKVRLWFGDYGLFLEVGCSTRFNG